MIDRTNQALVVQLTILIRLIARTEWAKWPPALPRSRPKGNGFGTTWPRVTDRLIPPYNFSTTVQWRTASSFRLL